jgi:metal-sulfur cluster biosynthetic enzyme
MRAFTPSEGRQGELWRRLAEVNDPELDDPVTDMGFIERAEVSDDGAVTVDFRLPTYWCSPNFAFIMLDDIRSALEALSWSPSYRITLKDHMFAEEVNRGIAEGRSFADIFATLGEDMDLAALREKFRQKAFKRRQEGAILDLKALGIADSEIVRMTLGMFDAILSTTEPVERRKRRYRQALVQRWNGIGPRDAAIVTYDGQRIARDALAAHLAELRSVRINMEFNGALCRGLKQTRYKELDVVDGEPTLVDFILDRVPAPEVLPRLPNT